MLRDACLAMSESIGQITAYAPIYETEPMGAADSLFLNSALTICSQIAPFEVMNALLAIEKKLGRVRLEKWGNRTIDLDLLLGEERDNNGLWKKILINSPALVIPHPEMLKRSFVMLPAVDVAGEWIHPTTHLKLADAIKKYVSSDDLKNAKPHSESMQCPHLPK
jgi:2-amino-4-hydroxy-6-hydroxymethyldihydropteridine diphosphokinase